MDIKQELRNVIEKHKNDKLMTFQTNISAMAKDCLREIESLEEELDISRAEVQALSKRIVELQDQKEVLIDTVNMLSPLVMENHELKKDCDYWKREALKWANEIGEQRIGPLLWMDEERVRNERNQI